MNIEKSNIAKLPTKHGNFLIKAYKHNNQEHLAIMSEDLKNIKIPFVRIHSECLTGDALGSLKCDCQAQLNSALDFIAKNGGLVIYHKQEGRNIGLFNKVNAYALQDKGKNTIEANLALGFSEDERDYSIVCDILEDLNLDKIKLITNNPKKLEFVELCGVEIEERIPTIVTPNVHNEHYLAIKKDEMGHLL